MTAPDLTDLARLLADRDAARLARIEDEARRIAEAQADLARSASGQSNAMHIAGADVAWWTWMRRRQSALEAQAAMRAADRADALDAVRRSTGRRLALETLAREARLCANRAAQRRSEIALSELAVLSAARERQTG